MSDIQKRYQLLIERYDRNKVYLVSVTHINNPHDFYVCSADSSDLTVLETPGRHAHPSDLHLGTDVVFHRSSSKSYVRGQIVTILEDSLQKYSIFAMDYGYTDDEVDLQNIFLPKYELGVPPLAMPCKLWNCQPTGLRFTEELIEEMRSCVRGEYCRMRVIGFESARLVVELRIYYDNDVGHELTVSQYSNLGLDQGALDQAMANTPIVSYKQVNIGDILNIRVLRAKNLYTNTFHVALIADFRKYMKDRLEFTEYCRYEGPMTKEKIKVDQPVGHKGRYDMHYERAVVKTVTQGGTKASILMIDTGEVDDVKVEDLKDIQNQRFFIKPGIAFQCTFFEMNEGRKTLPAGILPGYEAWIKIIDSGEWNIVQIVPRPD